MATKGGGNYSRNILSQIQTWPDTAAIVVPAKQVESAGALSPKDERMERCGGNMERKKRKSALGLIK